MAVPHFDCLLDLQLWSGVEEMYLYLVDEEIVIKAASPKAKEFVPSMRVGLKALCATNKVAGLAKCLGFPAPTLMTKELHGLADDFVNKINEKSSVAGFDCLQSAVDEGFSESLEGSNGDDAEQKKLRGSKLREFKRFLEENDSKKLFGGLERVQKEDGSIVWTLPAKVDDENEEVEEVEELEEEEVKVRSLPKAKAEVEEEEKTEEPEGPQKGWLFKRAPKASDGDASKSSFKSFKRQAAGIFGGVQKQWQKRYCIIEEGWLMYFKDEGMKELKGRIALNEVNEVKTGGVTEEGDEVPESGAAFSFEQGGREWVFAASSEGEMKEWARKISGS
ncbi:hypothetical protein TrLO_g12527 [Triparma laevis f. longispina]|uniref:PH domain-containing protein n=1 Tax=Triparma laevis f. longispina TaxID=1714387 RepID=A0A9W7EEP5_9STRA|nr:hypothetical protein TrLO_g12527 [Triparma laevis f. longispina]